MRYLNKYFLDQCRLLKHRHWRNSHAREMNTENLNFPPVVVSLGAEMIFKTMRYLFTKTTIIDKLQKKISIYNCKLYETFMKNINIKFGILFSVKNRSVVK